MKNKNNEKRDVLSGKNNTFHHLLRYQKIYLGILLILVLTPSLIINLIKDQPLIMGGESYYHLEQAKEITARNFHYYPLSLAVQFLGNMVIFVPILLGLASLYLFLYITEKNKTPARFSFMASLFLIISPATIFVFGTISFYSYLTFLILLGITLLNSKNFFISSLSLIPIILATFFDIFNSILLLVLMIVIFYLRGTERNKLPFFAITLIVTSLIINLLLQQPILLGPFHIQQTIPDFISDLGGLSGISFFLAVTAFIGLFVTWKRKNFYFSYFFIPLLIPAYVFNSGTIFIITVITAFFSASGFTRLFDRVWTLKNLKKFTFLLLILGLTFSTIAYLDRITEIGPTQNEITTLNWMKENLPQNAIIFSAPENGYYIQYFTDKKAFHLPHLKNKEKNNVSQEIITSTYIADLFPLLEKNNISIIYLTPTMKEDLPENQGLLFLLTNERFKLVHESNGLEVWIFTKNAGDVS